MSVNYNLHCCLCSLFLLRDYDYIHHTRLEELSSRPVCQHHVTCAPYLHYHQSLQLQAKTFYIKSYCCNAFIPIVLLVHFGSLYHFGDIHPLASPFSSLCINNNSSEFQNNIPSLSFRHKLHFYNLN